MEQPMFFPRDKGKLFGILHRPTQSEVNRAVILCHAFGEEKLWSHRVFVNFARETVKHNFAVLRFDFMGHGDSSGDTQSCTVDSYLTDIDAAVKTLLSYYPKLQSVTLLGLRFGATLACLYAKTHGIVKNLVLWEPVIDGRKYMQELLRINLSTQLATAGSIQRDRSQLIEAMQSGASINVDGYLISNTFFQQCSEIKLSGSDTNEKTAAVLVSQIVALPSQKDRPELTTLANHYYSGSFHKIQEPPFWREIKPFCSKADNLISDTIAWMESTSADSN